MRSRPWLRALLAPAAALAAILIAAPGPATLAQGSVERTLFVSAVDKKGIPVEGLGPDAFIVRENGVRREVLRVSRATEPIDLTVMIDNSAAAMEEMPYYRTAIPKFLAELAPANPIALVGLADRPTILVPSTTDLKRLTSRAEGLFAMPGSGMTLLDAMVEVSDGLRKRDSARAAIVAIATDGVEFTDRFANEVVEALKKARVAVHLVTIGTFIEDQQQAIRERAFFITRAPRATGGQHLSMVAPNALGMNLERVARELNSQYKVVYARPDTLIAPDSIEIAPVREDLIMRGTPERSQKGA
ncbi:MAG TPA: VWA domain-containing protein [Vicinamibacterales bacterium]|nr:VWA domain-containing protein [Vicinamibacterales bacterium]